MLLLRTSMQRWRDQTASELDLYSRVSTLANNQRLRAALTSWRLRLKEKRRMDWQNDMRRKMKMVREKREASLRKDAWAKWRQSYRSHLSGQHYIERLVFRFFQRWKTRLLEVDHQEAVGDEFLGGQEHKVVERCWNYWKRTTELRNAERSALDSVGLRIMGDALEVWKKHT
jgi:protein SFI1